VPSVSAASTVNSSSILPRPQRLDSDLDLVYVGNKTDVIMIEGAADELPEADFVKALHFAQSEVVKIVAGPGRTCRGRRQGEARNVRSCSTRRMNCSKLRMPSLVIASKPLSITPSKVARGKAVGALKDEVSEAIKAKFPEATSFEISQAFDYLQKKAFRISILDKKNRCDGRGIDQIRPLSGEASVLPRTHGSATFTRGETMALAIATLAPADEAQEMDTYAGGPESQALHPTLQLPSVLRRRDRLASAARTVAKSATARSPSAPSLRSSRARKSSPTRSASAAKSMESNGSTSMASVCSGVMALMDAGVPIKRPVAGTQRRLVLRIRRREDEPLPDDARHHRQRRPFRRHGLQALRHRPKASPAIS